MLSMETPSINGKLRSSCRKLYNIEGTVGTLISLIDNHTAKRETHG